VGHGSSEAGGADPSLLAHAAALQARRLFAEVRVAVLYGTPGPWDALAGLKARELILAPLLMCDGHCARDVLPRAFGLAGPVTLRFGRRFTLCPPLGLQPGLSRLMISRAGALARHNRVPAEQATLLLIGHGSPRDPASRRAVLWHAAAARAAAAFGSVRVAFLDEPPYLEEALRRLHGPAVAVGLFAGEGRHAGRDVPGAIARHARVPVHDLGAIGADPGIPELVLEQVAARERSLATTPLAI
jgi:sirohydrochlorin cobaltochelatase